MTLQFEGFTRYSGVEDHIEKELPNGNVARATLVFDQDTGPSWENGDGYGIVSDWRPYSEHYSGGDYKAPGERVLCKDDRGGSARFYDVQASTKKAREEGWGCGVDAHEHKTEGEKTACAVEQDFQFHRAWCEDRWQYVGVVLSIIDADGEDVDDHAGSLWGIECGYDEGGYKSWEYLTEVANDLLSEYTHAHPEALVDAPTCEHDADEDHMNCTECGKCSESLDCQEYCRECGGHECEIAHPGSDEATDEECDKCDECKHVAHYAGRCWADPDCFCEHGRAA